MDHHLVHASKLHSIDGYYFQIVPKFDDNGNRIRTIIKFKSAYNFVFNSTKNTYQVADIIDGIVLDKTPNDISKYDQGDQKTYFLIDKTLSIKIGKSNNLTKRINSLKTANPGIQIYHTPNNSLPEKILHQLFWQQRHNGEWFFFTTMEQEDFDSLIKDYEPIENALILKLFLYFEGLRPDWDLDKIKHEKYVFKSGHYKYKKLIDMVTVDQVLHLQNIINKYGSEGTNKIYAYHLEYLKENNKFPDLF